MQVLNLVDPGPRSQIAADEPLARKEVAHMGQVLLPRDAEGSKLVDRLREVDGADESLEQVEQRRSHRPQGPASGMQLQLRILATASGGRPENSVKPSNDSRRWGIPKRERYDSNRRRSRPYNRNAGAGCRSTNAWCSRWRTKPRSALPKGLAITFPEDRKVVWYATQYEA